ncbi:DUF4153 domain-containing protein, partial [Enterobacter cloacae]
MENSETLSPSTRLAVVLVGALQGLICYGISEYIAYAKLPSDTVWSLCVMPATVAMTATVALSVTSFRKPLLWLALAIVGAVVAGMGAWLKWSVSGLEHWEIKEAVLVWGFHLLLMMLLMLPWLQRRLSPATTASFYSDFYDKHWHNALTILTIFISNGL